jgi:hypothetical protein
MWGPSIAVDGARATIPWRDGVGTATAGGAGWAHRGQASREGGSHAQQMVAMRSA